MNLLKLEMFKHVLETLTMELSAKVVQCSIINIYVYMLNWNYYIINIVYM